MDKFDPLPKRVEELASITVDSAFKVHSTLGPGLLESVYEICLVHELKHRGMRVERQVAVPFVYDTVRFDIGFRLDILVEEQLIVELKAVETMMPLFDAQLLTYLKLTGHRLGLLINFNVPLIKDGIRRIIL